ncbi:MAG TPA: permease, partial [bacterium]|nr:permease [bacterium]
LVPESWVVENLGSEKLWTVPVAVLIGIPLYSNATGIIPVAESLLAKGLPVGTTLAFMMSTVAASFPEFILLKQVMKKELLFIFFFILLVLFTMTGWILNFIF